MTTRLAPLALAVFAAGCTVDNNVSVEPFGVCAPSDDGSSESCAPNGECDEYVTGFASLWLQKTDELDGTGLTILDNGLYLFMQYNNQLKDNEDFSSGHPNSNDAYITEYRISYSALPGAATPAFEIPEVRIPTVAPPIPADGTTTPIVPLIPVELSDDLQETIASGDTVLVKVSVRAAGEYQSGDSFETGPFMVPVYVTNAIFPGYTCPKVGDVPLDVCPNSGQTSSFACEVTDEAICDEAGARCGDRGTFTNGVDGTLYTCAEEGANPTLETVCVNGCVLGSPDACAP